MTSAYADLTTLKSGGVLNITGSGFDGRLLALLEDVSRWIDAYCNRRFYVLAAARQFDADGGPELNIPDLVGVTSLKTDEDRDRVFEVAWSSSDYLLYPLNAEPQQPWGRPYTRVLVDREAGSRRAFPSGRATVEISGRWGFREVTEDSGANLDQGGPLSDTATMLTVTDGSRFAVGQTLLLGSEQLYVTGVAANDLAVTRGVNGTDAASHPDGADIGIFRYPGAVVEACLMQVARLWRRKDSAFGLSAGSRATGGASSVAMGLDPDAERLLTPYRRLPVGVGV